MKERQIILWPHEVRGILDGRQTQIRRIVKPQPEVSEQGNLCGEWLRKPLGGLILPKLQDIVIHCPHGKIGDRLWGKEPWHTDTSDMSEAQIQHEDCMSPSPIFYKADPANENAGCIWRSPVVMPRWASRINLEITNIRVERLNDISEEDAIAEGITEISTRTYKHLYFELSGKLNKTGLTQSPCISYRGLWESLNGKDSWDLNPWVWKIEFRRV